MRDNFDDEQKEHLKIKDNKEIKEKHNNLNLDEKETRRKERNLCVITLMKNKKNI